MKISELPEINKQHLAYRLDNNTSCGLIVASNVALGKYGDMDLVDVFIKFGDRTPHSAKILARKVIDFDPTEKIIEQYRQTKDRVSELELELRLERYGIEYLERLAATHNINLDEAVDDAS